MKCGYIAGIDLGGTKINTAIATLDGDIISQALVPTEADKGKEAVWGKIFYSLEKAKEKAPEPISKLLAIGIGVPGPVDYITGSIRICPNIPGWVNVKAQKILKEKYNTKIYIENDARAAGLAEARRGAGRGKQHIFYTTVSTGIGGALILNGEIYHGAQGAAGEIGHIKITKDKSFEELASGTAIKRIFGIDPKDLKKEIAQGNPKAQEAMEHLVYYLALGLGNVATLLNPEVIILGGGLSNLDELLFPPLEQQIRKNAFSISGENIQLVKASLGDESGVIGALEICRNRNQSGKTGIL